MKAHGQGALKETHTHIRTHTHTHIRREGRETGEREEREGHAARTTYKPTIRVTTTSMSVSIKTVPSIWPEHDVPIIALAFTFGTIAVLFYSSMQSLA